MPASLNKEIKYDTHEHGVVLDAVRSRYYLSRTEMTKRWPAWRKLLREEKAYMSPVEKARKDKSRKDNDMELKIPFAWAMQQTALMYLTSVFLGRAPIFQYTARHGEGQDQVQAMESLIDYQVQVGEMPKHMFTWMNDALGMGLGIVGEYWQNETVRARRFVEQPVMLNGIPVPGKTEKVEEFVEIPGYQGNELFNVRVFDFFPDPRVTISNLQDGEFVGRIMSLGFHEIQAREADGEYFNIAELKQRLKNKSAQSGMWRERGLLNEDTDIPDSQNTMYGEDSDTGLGYVECLEMVISVIPTEWGFGTSKYPEKWVFTVANDELLIGCRPLGLLHDRFPFHALEYEIDGHNVHSRSMTEIIKPMNDVMTWMFNSHIYNVRKTINNELVVDPSRINLKDFQRKGPGRLIRLKPAAYGTNPADAVHQLNMNDVTRGHLNDINQVKNLMQMILGVNDSLMGAMGGGGRKTATEVRTSSTMGINRLKTVAEYFSATGFQSLSHNLVTSTQQLYTDDRKYKIAGNNINQRNGENFMTIDPESIAGFYDFVPVDGTMPVDRMMQANLFKEILMGAMQIGPEFAARYDIGAIFEQILMLSGIKNIDSFKIQVMPPGAPPPPGATAIPLNPGSSGRVAPPPGSPTAQGANPAAAAPPTAGSPQNV